MPLKKARKASKRRLKRALRNIGKRSKKQSKKRGKRLFVASNAYVIKTQDQAVKAAKALDLFLKRNG